MSDARLHESLPAVTIAAYAILDARCTSSCDAPVSSTISDASNTRLSAAARLNCERHHFARAFADADVADRVLARVVPVDVEAGVDVVRGNEHQVLEAFLDRLLPDARHPAAEALAVVTLGGVQIEQPVHRLGRALRRHGTDRHAVVRRVALERSAENDLKVRDFVRADVAARPIEPDVADVVKPARIRAAAHADVNGLHHRIELKRAALETRAQLGAETARAGDAELARIGARTGRHVGDRLAP